MGRGHRATHGKVVVSVISGDDETTTDQASNDGRATVGSGSGGVVSCLGRVVSDLTSGTLNGLSPGHGRGSGCADGRLGDEGGHDVVLVWMQSRCKEGRAGNPNGIYIVRSEIAGPCKNDALSRFLLPLNLATFHRKRVANDVRRDHVTETWRL